MSDSDWTPNYGQLDAAAPAWGAKRPVRIALLGDFGAGAAAGRLDTGDDLARRKPRPVEFDSLEDWLGQQNITLNLPVGVDGSPVEIPLADLESFHPDTLFREVELFRKLNDLRKRLNKHRHLREGGQRGRQDGRRDAQGLGARCAACVPAARRLRPARA